MRSIDGIDLPSLELALFALCPRLVALAYENLLMAVTYLLPAQQDEIATEKRSTFKMAMYQKQDRIVFLLRLIFWTHNYSAVSPLPV
jgi:hypothetical protein